GGGSSCVVVGQVPQVRAVGVDRGHVRREVAGEVGVGGQRDAAAVGRPALLDPHIKGERGELAEAGAVDVGGEQGLPEVLPVGIDEAQRRPVRGDLGVGHAAAGAGGEQVAVCAGEVHAPDGVCAGAVVEVLEDDPGPVGGERRRGLAAVLVTGGEVGEAAAVGVHEHHRAERLTGGVVKL